MNIEGAGALVTGAASGLRAAVARMLAARGAAVTILTVTAKPAKAGGGDRR